MIRLGIGKQIIFIAIFPALIVATLLSTYYIWNQFNYLSESLSKNGKLIAKQLAPAAEYAVYSGNTEFIKPLVNSIFDNNPVLRVQILDSGNNTILDAKNPDKKFLEKLRIGKSRTNKKLSEDDEILLFIEPILSAQIHLEEDKKIVEENSNNTSNNIIGKIIVSVSTKLTRDEQTKQKQHGIIITLSILLITTLIIISIINNITRPIKSLTKTVRNITSGNLDTHIDINSAGELGILESCINQMRSELQSSQSNHEIQLDNFTKELRETLKELEIRNVELDITRTKAINASKAKSEFLANMSHEIRTPLSGIIGFTELLQGTTLSRQQKDYTSTIEKSSKNLLQIINDILDLSKIESGRTIITSSEFNVVDIIEDIINLLSSVALDKNIELFYRIEQNVPIIIKSDPFRTHQILTNLIGNAIKFTEKGYVYLQVTTGEEDNRSANCKSKDSISNSEVSIKFSISDTGIGMSKSDKQKLFKAFTQADASITRRFGGTGLGLVISRKLTLLMKGKIDFYSTEGKGSTFWFCVPVIPVSNELKKPRLAEIKIALISDHFIAKQAFKNLFTNAQCTVNEYSIKELTKLSNIENNNDVIVVFFSRNEINKKNTVEKLRKLSFSKPSLLIASTRSHNELRNLQQHSFDSAVFTSEKSEHIKLKLINVINKKPTELNIKNINTEITENTDWGRINVMVVDDNEVNLRLTEIILRKHKSKVTTARSGEQALDYAGTQSFDIIFMDLQMPGMDGYATTKKIRGITPGKQPVIIALTANAMPQEKGKVIKSGMNGILIKPISDAILQKVLKQWFINPAVSKDSQISSINAPEFNDQNSSNITANNSGKNRKDLNLNNNIFSINIAKEFTGGNEELAYELFSMLRAELGDYSEAISLAVKNKDLKTLLNQVHKLHGASCCCGTEELKNTSSHIENLINQNVNFDIEKETHTLLIAINNVMDYTNSAH